MTKWKQIMSRGLGITGLVTGAYLALPWFTNSVTWNTLLGWIIGVLSAGILFVDGFQNNWKDKLKIGFAITGLLTAFYLVPSWVPNNNVANAVFGVLLLIFGALSFKD